jgi:hypothetical protein
MTIDNTGSVLLGRNRYGAVFHAKPFMTIPSDSTAEASTEDGGLLNYDAGDTDGYTKSQ